MQIDLGPELDRFRAEIRAWIEANAPAELAGLAPWNEPAVGSANRERERAEAMEHPAYATWERRLAEARLICPHWPEQYGGRGLSPLEMVVLEEECAGAGVPRIERGMGERLVGPAVLAPGTPEQQAHFLPRIVSGEDVYCQGYSEPDHGSDLAAVATRGVIDGDEIVITGQKTWTSGAHRANMIFILCRTDPDAPRHRGLSYVLARFHPDNNVRFHPLRQLTGSSGFSTTYFDGTRAPLSAVIGGVNNGWRPAMTTLGFERGGRATTAHLGFELEFWELVRQVRASGRDRDPLVREQLAWAYTHIALMRFAGLRLTAELAVGRQPGPQAAMAKVLRTEYHRRFGEIALGLMGSASLVRPDGEGYATDQWQAVFLASRAGTIYSGTSEIQRNIIAERLLGLPKS
jgi:alkylation response protein AidB-like acyl-CoA dehydrogenase